MYLQSLQYTSNQPDQDFLEGALCFAKECEDFVPTQTLFVLIIIIMESNAIIPTIAIIAVICVVDVYVVGVHRGEACACTSRVCCFLPKRTVCSICTLSYMGNDGGTFEQDLTLNIYNKKYRLGHLLTDGYICVLCTCSAAA